MAAVSAWRVRDPRAAALTEISVVVAVLTILATRGGLALAGYPQVGGSTLHIAHMLWGGLAMMVGFYLILQGENRVWKPVAAFVFGIGLGLFVDEVGKFITQTNDYFFRPAVAVMYVIFVAVFLATRTLDALDRQPAAEQVYDAVRLISEAALRPLTAPERDEALARLDAAEGALARESGPGAAGDGAEGEPGPRPPGAAVGRLENARNAVGPAAGTRGVDPALLARMAADARVRLNALPVSEQGDGTRRLWHAWDRMIAWLWSGLENPRVRGFVLGTLTVFAVLVVPLTALSFGAGLPVGFAGWISLVASVASAAAIAYGGWSWWRGRRRRGLQAFAISLLVELLVVQVFTFVDLQFGAVAVVVVQVLTFGVVRAALALENREAVTGRHAQ